MGFDRAPIEFRKLVLFSPPLLCRTKILNCSPCFPCLLIRALLSLEDPLNLGVTALVLAYLIEMHGIHINEVIPDLKQDQRP